MNVIAKISCHFERSVVTLKLRKEYLNTVTYNTPILLRIKYWTVWYIGRYSTGWPQNGTILLYAWTSSNINQFSKLFHCQNQEKICNNTVTKDPTTVQVCRYTTLWNVSVSLIPPLVSGVAGLSASSSRKADHWTFDVKTVGCYSYFRL